MSSPAPKGPALRCWTFCLHCCCFVVPVARACVSLWMVGWLEKGAGWKGALYTDTDIPHRFRPEGREPV